MTAFLTPVERPRGVLLRIAFFFTRRQFGKVASPLAVFSAWMPAGFLTFYGKISRLDRKLVLAPRTAVLIREQVASVNGCALCMDASRWYAVRQSPDNEARFDALGDYRTSPLFSEAERAVLDYALALTRDKHVDAETFARLRRHYSERQVCDIVWLIASEHLYNVTNVGLNIGSDGFCELRPPRSAAASKATRAAAGSAPGAVA